MAAPCIRPRNQQTLSRKPSVCISVFVIRKLTVFAKCFPPCLFFSLLRRRQYLPTKLFIRIFLSFPLTSETNLCHWGRWHSSLLADWFEFAKVGNGGRRGVNLCFERARKILKGMGSVGGEQCLFADLLVVHPPPLISCWSFGAERESVHTLQIF